jgi:hypothetical protein
LWKQGLAGLLYLFTPRSSIRTDGVPARQSLTNAGWESEQVLADAVFRALEVEAMAGTVIAGDAKAADRYRYRMELVMQRASCARQYYDLVILEIIGGFAERVSLRAQEFLFSTETLALFTHITYQTRELADRAFRVAPWIWGVLAAIAVLRILRSLYLLVSTPARYRKDPYHHPTAT